MTKEIKSCCTDVPTVVQSESSRKAFKKFAIGFTVVIALIIVTMFFVQNTPIGRHFFMSPQEMPGHLKK